MNDIKKSPADTAWESIKSASDLVDHDKLKVLLYAPTKQGKSRACALFGKRPLIGLCEQQAVVTIKRANPNASVFQIQNAKDLSAFRDIAMSERARKTFDAICLDGVTDAQRILRTYYTAKQGTKAGTQKTSQESWGLLIDATAKFIRDLRDIPLHVLVTALDQEESVEGVGIVHRPGVSGKRLPNDLGQYFNAVGYLHTAQRARGLRREVLFRANEQYLVGAPDFLDDVEVPDPSIWIAKMEGLGLNADMQARVDVWQAIDQADDGSEQKEGNNDDE